MQLIYFQSYGNLRITASAYSLQYLIVNATFTLISGGWAGSPITVLLIASPLIAYMTISLKAAFIHTILVFLFVLGLLLAHISGVVFTDISNPDNYHYTKFIGWLAMLIILGFFFVICNQLSPTARK
jgi:hypothetical protein